MSYKAVIFDFGGVFTTSPVEKFADFERANNLPDRFLGGVIKQNHHTNAWAQFERSQIGLDEFNVLFAAETKAAGHEVSGRTLISLLTLELKPEMISAFDKIRAAGFKTGCITNNLPGGNSTAMLDDDAPRQEALRVLAAFDHVIESSKAGIRKPEPRIYEMMCEALDLAPCECIFIDDLGINLKPAKAMGMATVKAPFGDVSPAITALFELLGL